jgi:transcriptional regulator GlxA family with amidase domain
MASCALMKVHSGISKATSISRLLQMCRAFSLKHVDMPAAPSATSSAEVGTFKSMMLHIQNHFAEDLSLEAIAAAGNVGKTLCAKLFKKYVSMTPWEYLIHYRIHKSIELMAGTDMSITEISHATGFSSASHYAKTFREIMGCTPSKFRKDHAARPFEHRLIPQRHAFGRKPDR